MNTDLSQLLTELENFRQTRGWKPYNNPKDLAISISIEAAELLENFQWVNWQEATSDPAKLENISEEIADVLIYTLTLLTELGLDFETVIKQKLVKNAKKYPAPQSATGQSKERNKN